MGKCTTCNGIGKIHFKTSRGRSSPTDCHSCLGTGKSSDMITGTDISNNRKKMFDSAQEQRNKRYLNDD
jgi:hypothetical protein